MVSCLNGFHVVLCCVQWQVAMAPVISTQDVQCVYLISMSESSYEGTKWIGVAHIRNAVLVLPNGS